MESEQTLARARTGDEDAFRDLVEPYRKELQVHCYRIVGSVEDAEDLLQETLLAAWRGLRGFEGRSSVRAWLYRITTNRCLNALRDGRRRPREARATDVPAPTRLAEPVWVQPYPDALLDAGRDPHARYETRETIGLAFVTALQHLPPRQRVALVLRDVLGFRTAEVAEMLGATEASIKGALRRARATLEQRVPAGTRDRAPLPDSSAERAVAGRFADAVERGDTDGVVALLTDDGWLTMPPEPYEFQGHAAIAAFLRGRLRGQFRLVPTRANGQPAFGCYALDPTAAIRHAYGVLVLTLDGTRIDGAGIATITWFGDRAVFPYFGLPRTLPA